MPLPLSSVCGRRSASRHRAYPACSADHNVAVASHTQYVPMLTASSQLPDTLTQRWVKRPSDLDLWSFELESGVRVTCDVGYLCANFGLPRSLCSRLRSDVRDRQTSDRQMLDSIITLMPPPIRGGGIITATAYVAKIPQKFLSSHHDTGFHRFQSKTLCCPLRVTTFLPCLLQQRPQQ